MSDDGTITLTVGDKTYTLNPDDLELGELELLEDEMGGLSVDEINFRSGRAMRVLVYIAVHRVDPEFTMDDAKRVKVKAVADLNQPSNGNGDKPAGASRKRPTKAAKSG